MHTVTVWRMLPPAGAPLTLGGIAGGLAGCFAGEKRLERLRGRLRDFTGMPHVSLHGSGREALAALLAVLRAQRPGRDEVALPAYGSYTLPAAAVRAGCRVALYDIDPASLAPRLESVRAALSPRALALVACHQYGFPFDLAPLAALCRERGVLLVDDAAQALGARQDGILAGTMGDVGLYSLGRGKNITAVAGGIMATRDAALGRCLREAEGAAGRERAQSLPARFARLAVLLGKALALWALRRPALYRLPASLPWLKIGVPEFNPGFAFRPFAAFQAGLARDGLDRLEALNAARKEKAALYEARLREGDRQGRRHRRDGQYRRDGQDGQHGQEGQEDQNRQDGGADLAAIAPLPGALPVYPRFPVLLAPRNAGLPAPRGVEASGVSRGRANGPCALGGGARALGISPGHPLALHEIPDLARHLVEPARAYPGAELLARHLVTLPTHEETGPKDCEAACAYLEKRFFAAARGKEAVL